MFQLRHLFVITVAVTLAVAISAAPVAANDTLDDTLDLGGDEIDIGTDGISIGDDGTVSIDANTEGVAVDAGEDVSVGAGTDGVDTSVGGEEGLEVGAGPNDGVSVGGAVDDIEAGPDDTGFDGLGDIDGVTTADESGGLAGVEDTVGGLTDEDVGVDSLGEGTESLEGVDGLTESQDMEVGTDDLPQNGQVLSDLLGGVPAMDELDPENVPVGDERADTNICDPTDLEAGDLPADALPGPDDIPEEFAPPGVPTTIVTNDAVLSIAFGMMPAPCEVFNPSDPQINPADLPDDPDLNLDVAKIGPEERLGQQGASTLIYFDGTLSESDNGPGVSGMTGGLANPAFGDSENQLYLSDGRNTYGLEPRFRYDEDRTRYEAVSILLGKDAGIAWECQQLDQVEPDISMDTLEENPTGPCGYELIGLPDLFGPEEAVAIISGVSEQSGDEPPVNTDALPVNYDALLNI